MLRYAVWTKKKKKSCSCLSNAECESCLLQSNDAHCMNIQWMIHLLALSPCSKINWQEINLSCLILVWISSTDGMATDVLLYLLLKTNLVVLQIQRWLTWGCLLVSVSVVYIKIYIYEFPICTIYYWWDVFRSHSLTRENICQSVPLI